MHAVLRVAFDEGRSHIGTGTREISQRGLVLPVGGIKEKVLAAQRAGLAKVLIPARNEKDLRDVPQSVRDTLDDAVQAALAQPVAGAAGACDGWECARLVFVGWAPAHAGSACPHGVGQGPPYAPRCNFSETACPAAVARAAYRRSHRAAPGAATATRRQACAPAPPSPVYGFAKAWRLSR